MIDDPQKKLDNFFKERRSFRYKKGEIILHAGDMPQGVMYLKKGYARLSSISKEGKELTLVIYRLGEVFPVVWTFFGQKASIYDLDALTDCEIVRTPREELSLFFKDNPDVLVSITRHIITRFQLALRRMTYLTFGDASAKLASILLICGKEFGESKNGFTEIKIPLTHKDISNLVWVTRETVSIELKKFEREGVIKYNKKLIILKDTKTLEKKSILA